jgi:hypothetical protein
VSSVAAVFVSSKLPDWMLSGSMSTLSFVNSIEPERGM